MHADGVLEFIVRKGGWPGDAGVVLLPDPQLSILIGKYHILFVYPMVLGAVNCEDR